MKDLYTLAFSDNNNLVTSLVLPKDSFIAFLTSFKPVKVATFESFLGYTAVA